MNHQTFPCRQKDLKKPKPGQKECNKTFSSEEELQAHMLFEHYSFMPPCSTGLAGKQHLEANDLRYEWHSLKRTISFKISYFKKKFKDHKLNNRYSILDPPPPLPRWLDNAANGKGWMNVKDIDMFDTRDYDDVGLYLAEIYKTAVKKREIELQCRLKGYILE